MNLSLGTVGGGTRAGYPPRVGVVDLRQFQLLRQIARRRTQEAHADRRVLGVNAIDFPSFFLKNILRNIYEFQFKRNISKMLMRIFPRWTFGTYMVEQFPTLKDSQEDFWIFFGIGTQKSSSEFYQISVKLFCFPEST